MTYLPPANGGRINATIGGNTAGAGALVSSGTLTLAGGNNVTLSQNGNAITIAGAAGAAGSNTFGMSNLSNTSGTTGVVSGSAVQFVLAGGSNVTLNQSINASSGTITIVAASQTVQTQSRFNLTLAGNTTGTLAQISSGVMTLAGGNNIVLSQNGNAVTVSASSQSAQTQSNIQALYDGTNSISTGTVRLSNANGVSFGMNGQTLTASHNAITSQTVQTQNVHNVVVSGGNSTSAGAGFISVSSGTLTLAGGNNVTLSQNGNAITISAGAGGGGGGIALANSQTAFTSGTVSLAEAGGAITIASSTNGASQSFNFSVPQTSSLMATGVVSISTTGSTISIGAPNNGETVSRFVYPSEYIPLNTIGATNNTVSFNYVSVDQDVSANQFRALFSVSANTHTSASTNTYGLTAEVGVYTRNASTISKMSSGSQTWSGTYSTNSTASVQGIRELTVPVNMALSAGEYWFGFRISSSSVNASVGYSQYVVSNQQTAHFNAGRLGAGTNATQLLYPWHGLYATTSGALPASATLNDVQGTGTKGSAAMYWFDLRNYTVL